MKNLKNVFRSKQIQLCLMLAAVVSMMAMGVSAEEPTSSAANATITTAFQSGFTSLASDALGMIAVIVPIGLGVAGTVFLVKKAMGWFKSLAK